MSGPKSGIIYQGPSQFNPRRNIVVIATGLDGSSENTKTGRMSQIWILNTSRAPSVIIQSNRDHSICGDCPLRWSKGGSCYVNPVIGGPDPVYKSWKSGIYEPISDFSIFSRYPVRFGSYGDPAAVPLTIWRKVLTHTRGWTSYTHAWRNPKYRLYKEFCMASVENEAGYLYAKTLGWRTFRVMSDSDSLFPLEIYCPASPSAGNKTTCAECQACKGTTHGNYPHRGDIAILVHGTKKGSFNET